MTPPTEDHLDLIIRPSLYSKRAILWFAFLVTPLFGGVLLMQNLKDIGKRKEATTIVIISLAMTLLTLFITAYFDIQSQFPTIVLNLINSLILTDFLFKKHIPDAQEYPKKDVWIPLLVAVVIILFFVFLAFWAEDLVV